MKTVGIAAALALLSACSPGRDRPVDRSTTSVVVKQHPGETVVQATPVSTGGDGLEGYPTAQPNGTPLTAAYCLRVGNELNNPFDNPKTCFMVACGQGDRASCEMAATYNGNLSQD